MVSLEVILRFDQRGNDDQKRNVVPNNDYCSVTMFIRFCRSVYRENSYKAVLPTVTSGNDRKDMAPLQLLLWRVQPNGYPRSNAGCHSRGYCCRRPHFVSRPEANNNNIGSNLLLTHFRISTDVKRSAHSWSEFLKSQTNIVCVRSHCNDNVMANIIFHQQWFWWLYYYYYYCATQQVKPFSCSFVSVVLQK